MKTRRFEVPEDMMAEFAGIIGEHELTNAIQGVNDDDEIIVDVRYDLRDRKAIFELIELLDPDEEDE